ncbi:hypothetical protein AX15_004923 [Amanita polypyramis BW_CC]|nr:hypothetical protein AX15_004923 [Amanita polypyramis BW_CC]
MSAAALRRVQKELADIKNNPIDVGVLAEPQEDNLFSWKCIIKAAPDSPYKNGTFHFSLTLPQNYPFKPPTVTFTTKIYHPGINEEGAICVPILRDEWKPTVTLSTVLAVIQEKVNNPSPDDPFEPEIAALLKDDKAKFLATAKEYTKNSKRSDPNRSRLPFSSSPTPSTLPEIPQPSDFRASLILTDLSKRFSLLRSPTGESASVQDLKSKFAQQRVRGASNQISEEEEDMLLETLGRMRSRTSALSEKSQDNVNELVEQHSIKSMSTTSSAIHASVTSSPSRRSTKRYSNNLFGSGRFRDYTYFRNAGIGHGRTGSTPARAPSITPTETSISIQEIASLPDSFQPVTSDSSSIQSSIENKATNTPFVISEGHLSIPDPSLLKRASMALAHAIKELEEETEDEVVMPRLSRPSPDLYSRQAEGIVELAKSSQSSLHQPTVIEAGTAISSDKQVVSSYHERRTSPVFSRTLPGYVPGMPRPMTPRDTEMEEQRSHSATPRAMSPLPSNITDNTSSGVPSDLSTTPNGPGSASPAFHQSSRPASPSATIFRPSTPSRPTPLFLQRSPSGRRTPESGSLGGDAINFDSPFNSSIMSKRRPVSPSTGHAYQSMSASSRPSTPSNVVWNVGLAETNQKSPGHDRSGSWPSEAGVSDGQSTGIHDSRHKHPMPTPLPDSPLLELVFGTDISSISTNRIPRSSTPTHGSPRSLAFPNMDTSPRNGSKRSSRQNTSSPFHFDNFPPLVLLPVVNWSRSSLESTGSSYHSWEGEKDRFLSILDANAQQPVWHDIPLDRADSFVSADEDEWDPEEIIGRYAGLRKSDFKAMQEKLVTLSVARDDARERAPSIRRRRPSTSQSNYSSNGRDRVASPPPASPITTLEHHLKATAVLNAMADSIQSRQPETINTSVQRVPDTEPSPNTRRHRDLAQALFGDDIEKEREQTPKPVSYQNNEKPAPEHSKVLTTDEPEGDNEGKLVVSPSPSQSAQSGLKPPDALQNTDLVREVQQKAEAATLALRGTPPSSEQRLERSAQGSIRRRINPSQISEPRLVSASTSVDTIPIRPSSHVNPGASKIGSRFRKLRGTLRAKNSPIVGDESYTQTEINSPPSSQDISYDAFKVKSLSGTLSAVENGRTKIPLTSPPASAGPGLKGFMARFRSKKGADNAPLDRRGAPHGSPSVISLAASQGDHTTVAQINGNDSAAPSSTSSFQQTLDHSQSVPSHQETAVISDPNQLALRQLFDAASNLGVDQNALNALLARTPSLSKPAERQTQERGVRPSMDKVVENANETAEQNQPIIVTSAEDEMTPSQSLLNTEANLERSSPNGVSIRKTEDNRRLQDNLSANVIVRRTIIYPSDSRASPIPLEVNSLLRKNSRRRRASVASVSSRSVQDRIPTPPPPKSPTSKSFSNSLSPPVPQIPRSLLPSSELPKTSPTSHSFEKSSSAYDSLYEMYSEDNHVMTASGNDSLAPPGQMNPDIPAIELIELANGETIWTIVNGLRDRDEESMYASRTSFTSELSARDGNSDNVHVYVKDHKRNGSKGSASSITSRRRLLHGKTRPETKVYYSSSAQIGHLIESLSQGVDTGTGASAGGPRPGHSASSSLSMPPSANDAHWTVEERLDDMLNSIRDD